MLTPNCFLHMKEELSLNAFNAIDHTERTPTYIAALEAFNRIEQLQELKQLERSSIPVGSAVLDVGCGFGLETVVLACRAGHGAGVCGVDKSELFVAEAKRRAAALGLSIEYRTGVAQALPYADALFDHVRAERLLIYLEDVTQALAEMRRVLRPTGMLALIEPDLSTATINVSDRRLLRRIMAHEADTAVAQSWLPGRLTAILPDIGYTDIRIASRVVILPQDLAASYFLGAAAKAAHDSAISLDELDKWKKEIESLHRAENLFATEGIFLFLCR